MPSPDPRDPRNKTIYLVREQIKTTTTYDKAGNIIKEVRTGSSYAAQIDITTEYIYSKPDKQGNPTLLEEKATGTGGYVKVYRIDNTYAKG